jgi:hypothetical protein
MQKKEESERAAVEDAAVARLLTLVPPKSTVKTTPESIALGDASIAAAYRDAPAQFHERIDRGELITAAEFCEALDVDVDWLSEALYDGRVFAMTGPDRRNYYPAFYAAPGVDSSDIEVVVKLLSRVEVISRFTFFYRIWTPLGSTPLEALGEGRLDEVVKIAIWFAEDYGGWSVGGDVALCGPIYSGMAQR